MVHERLGKAGGKVVVEECLVGQEASVMALVDGTTVLPLVVSQDFKRVGDGDSGPNTGGMGSISPTPVLSDGKVGNLVGDIFLPVLRELHSRGIHYSGFLYAGILVDRAGVAKVLEFNCRLGDPETQVLMMRMKSDLLSAIESAVAVKLVSAELEWRREAAACVVLCSAGYPGQVDDGKVISGLFEPEEGLLVFQSGTRRDAENPDDVVSSGGRILSVTALGADLNAAIERAYAGVNRISFDGMHYRKDIGASAVKN